MSLEFSKLMVLQPMERLDSKGGRVLQQQIVAIAPAQYPLLVIDMALIDFVDSSGLFALVAGLRSARQRGCRLVMCNVKETVQLIFEISQLDQVFEIFESYEAVLQTLAPELLPFHKAGLVAA